MKNYDVVVVGLGIMGASTLFHAARFGQDMDSNSGLQLVSLLPYWLPE